MDHMVPETFYCYYYQVMKKIKQVLPPLLILMERKTLQRRKKDGSQQSLTSCSFTILQKTQGFALCSSTLHNVLMILLLPERRRWIREIFLQEKMAYVLVVTFLALEKAMVLQNSLQKLQSRLSAPCQVQHHWRTTCMFCVILLKQKTNSVSAYFSINVQSLPHLIMYGACLLIFAHWLVLNWPFCARIFCKLDFCCYHRLLLTLALNVMCIVNDGEVAMERRKNKLHKVLKDKLKICDENACNYPYHCHISATVLLAARFMYLCTVHPGIVLLDLSAYSSRWLTFSRMKSTLKTIAKMYEIEEPSAAVRKYLNNIAGKLEEPAGWNFLTPSLQCLCKSFCRLAIQHFAFMQRSLLKLCNPDFTLRINQVRKLCKMGTLK